MVNVAIPVRLTEAALGASLAPALATGILKLSLCPSPSPCVFSCSGWGGKQMYITVNINEGPPLASPLWKRQGENSLQSASQG